ncbi:MAG TPA: hypothetical protein EYN32_02405 [Phycisphaerales bacterium]|nr:hypothetical protein [Phycisphaerales bacterium]
MFITPILVGSTLIALGDFQIEEVLPTEAVLACSVDNLNHICQSMITDEQKSIIQTIVSETFFEGKGDDFCTQFSDQCSEMFAKAGLGEDWKPQSPAGYAGFGIYSVADFEAGTVGIAMLGVVEVDPELATAVQPMVEFMTEMMEVESEVVNLAGEDVWMINFFVDPNFIAQAPMGLGQLLSMDRLYISSVNGYMICGTEPDGVSRAIAATSGDVEDISLATNETYMAMMDQIAEGDVQAVVMIDNLADLIIQADESRMIGTFLPMLKGAIGDIDGFAETVTVAPNDDVFLNASYTIWMPNGRGGLLGIASSVPSVTETPSFVGEDTVSYSQINVDFDKIAPWFRSVIAMIPMMPMPPQELDEMEQSVALALAPLGSTMHVVSSLTLPLSPNSVGFLLAVECEDSEEMETYLSTMMPMTGSEPREFLGYRIYPLEMPDGGMMTGDMDMSFSLAVGGGWAMLGMTNSVENALRLAAQPDNANKSANGNAASHLISTKGATAWGYADMGQSILASSELSEMQMKNMIEEMESFDPEMAAEMNEEFQSQMKTSKMITELMASFLGSTAWTMEANDEGFVAHAVLMRP